MKWRNKKVIIPVIVLAVILLVVGWRVVANVLSAREKAQQATQGRAVAVPVQLVERRTISPEVKFAGNLEPVWQAAVAPKVAGRIKAIYVDAGSFVRQGTVLAELEDSELSSAGAALQGSLLDAQTALRQAQVDYDRKSRLFEQGAVSKEELDNAAFAVEMASAKVVNAQGSYDNAVAKLAGSVLTAPHDGYVVKRNYQEGYYASAGSVLFELADISSLKIKLNVPEGQVAAVSAGTAVHVKIPALQDREVEGVISRLAVVADLPERTFAAEAVVPNPGGEIKGGLYAELTVKLAEKANALVVPVDALVMREDQRTVYVLDENNFAQRKVLTTGYIGDGLVEVLSGLSENDRVIVGGQNKVREGSKITVDEVSK